MPFLILLKSAQLPTPSYSFRMTFPANASQTMTSACPCGISLASILPIKLISSHCFQKRESLFYKRIALLFFCSDIHDSRLSDSSRPQHAPYKWNPSSQTVPDETVWHPHWLRSQSAETTPFSVGISGASGGLSTPLILPTITCPPTSTAPELPADTKASAFSFFHQLHADHNGRILLRTDRMSPAALPSRSLPLHLRPRYVLYHTYTAGKFCTDHIFFTYKAVPARHLFSQVPAQLP